MQRILVVDDEVMICDLIKMLLDCKSGGPYEVEVACNGRAAMVMWNTRPPYDLVITDWHMPDIDGLKLCAWLRSRDTEVPILLASSMDLPREAHEALPTGVVVLPKPFVSGELLAAVARALATPSEAHATG